MKQILPYINKLIYQYGFNGKEKDDEVSGAGNDYDFGARIYDPRIGKWMSIDQLAAKYPQYSPYSFGANNPILVIDKDGKDIFITVNNEKTGKTETVVVNAENVAQVLNSTKAGHELLAEYANNPKKDLYITIGSVKKAGDLEETDPGDYDYNEKGEKIYVSPQKKNSNGVMEYSGLIKDFEGTEIVNPDKESHFVILNEEEFSGGKIGLSLSKSKLAAKALGHGIGAHVDGELGTTETQQHNAWGQKELNITTFTNANGDYAGTVTSEGTGKAKELNNQIDKVSHPKRENVSTKKIQSGGKTQIHKVDVK